LPEPDDIIAAARAAGVVGARGGMPTHTKLGESAEIVIANGCECEPLVFSDRHLLAHHASEIITGLELAMAAAGARRGIVAYLNIDSQLDAIVRAEADKHPNVDVFHAPAFYPVDEEQTLTYEATGRAAPHSAAPAQAGVNVFNVETLFNLSNALAGRPVTHRTVTIGGEVARPCVARMPVGAKISDAIQQAGGPSAKSFRVLLGGPVSGFLVDDISTPITKTTAAILVLPTHHIQVQKRARSLAVMLLRARSACFQCRECTDYCTRRLVGREIEPHKIMRAICYSLDSLNTSITSAIDCGECGVCDSFVCKMGISPRLICRHIKAHLQAMGWEQPPDGEPGGVRDDYAARHISIDELVERLGVGEYVAATDLRAILHARAEVCRPQSISVPLLQHIGAASVPTVAPGDAVEPGRLIGEIPEGKLGARAHTALGGTVAGVAGQIEINSNAGSPVQNPDEAAAARHNKLPT